MSDVASIARHLRITGEVQGVGYRDWTVRTARAMGLTGWVRNRSDGCVELVASGPVDTVSAFIDACTRGPASARVADIVVRESEAPETEGFEFRPTL